MADGYISQIKTLDNKVYLLKDSEKGYKWNAVTQGQKWSRICLITPTIAIEGSSGILSVSCTRGNVVCNATFLITTSHSNKCFINTLGTTNYIAVRIRGVVTSDGKAYIELYDTAQGIASGTAQTWHCSYIPILGSTLTTYTSFTDGTTVPSGYTAVNDFTAPQGDNSAPIVSITRNSGTTFTATRSNGTTFTFTQQDNNTTYSAGTGLSLSNTTFNHSNSITAKTAYVDTVTTASANGGTIKVTDIKYDAQGHVTGSQDRTITLSQVTSYLPLAGGIMTGNIRRYYSAASTEPMITMLSNNQDIILWEAGHGTTAATTTTSNHYKLLYRGTGQDGDNSNQLRLIAHKTDDVIAIQIDEIGKITLPQMATGGAKTPIYINSSGVITAGDALKDLAYISKPTSNTTTTFLRGDGTWQTALTSHQSLAAYAKLASPAFTGTPTAPTAADGTNTTQIATTAFVMSQFKYNDAMLYKGVVNSADDLPAAHSQGWTYKVATAGTYAGVACEIGDMIICNTDGSSANDAHWNVIQTNIDGAVIGPAESTDNAIARFNGTTGKVIQNSKITIDDNGNLNISHATSATMTAASTNPKITFSESGTQPVHLIYSDYDSYRSPAGLKIIGGTSATPAWLEVEGNVYAAAFKGNADTATSAAKLTTARNLGVALGSTTAVTFDGSANQTSIPVSGTLGIAHGGTGQTTLTAARQQFSGPEFIVGTWTAASNTWTGVSIDSALYDGKQIILYMPFAGTSSAATLNLTLADGTTTGAKNVYFESTTRFTTHKGQNAQLHLIYHSGLKLSNGTTYEGWWYIANRDTTTTNATQVQYSGGIKANTTALVAANIIVGNSNGLYQHLKSGNAFDISYPILYLSAACAASATSANVFSEVNFTVTTTQSMTLTANKEVFIKGTLSGNTFTPVSTTPLTQTIATTDDGYVYIDLGYAYSTTAIRLKSTHNLYQYKNGVFQLYGGAASYAVNAGTASSVAWTNVSSRPTKISLTGAVTGSVSLGSGDLSIATTVNHTHSYLANTNIGAADRPIYITGNAATQTTYRMAGTNVVATTALAITNNLDTGIWYVNGTSGILSQYDGVAYVNKYNDYWLHEIYGDYRTGHIAVRGKNNGTWKDWLKILDSGNYTDYTVKKDGTGASGTWGISITGTAANVTGTVAIANGGTGKTTALTAATALGAPYLLVSGTEITTSSNLDSGYKAMGTYYSPDSTRTNTLAGTVPANLASGFKLITAVGYRAATLRQFLAKADNDLYYRSSQDTGATWTRWYKFVMLPSGTDSKTFAAIGGTTTPVYVNANGVITACTSYANASVASATNATNATKIAAKLATTTKTFLLGTSTTITGTAANVDLIGDTGVYLTTTAGQLNATTFKVNEHVTLQYNSTDSSLEFVFA